MLHTVESMLELPNPILFFRFSKPLRLLHVDNFIGRKKAVEIGHFDINLLHFPVIDCEVEVRVVLPVVC